MPKRYDTMSIKEFLRRDFREERRVRKEKRKDILLKSCLLATSIFVGGDMVNASGGTGIDVGARSIYAKLLIVGKWIIIFKGGIDTINNVVQGEYGMAKKVFLSYLVVYMVLNGLPWAMDEVDKVFKDI